MRKYIAIIIMATLCSGCELVVDVNVPVEKPVLTLNAFMIQDSVWTAQLSLSRHILDEEPHAPVADGFVAMYHHGVPVDTLQTNGDGWYMGNSMPVAGETYEIRATTDTHGTVRSTSYIPLPVEIIGVEVDIPQTSGGSGSMEEKIQMRLRMKDRPGEKNFYQVLLMVERKGRDWNTGQERLMRRLVQLNSKDPSLDNENVDSQEGIYFKDVLFDGKEVNLSLESGYWAIGSAPGKLIFLLRTISEDYYRYKTTAQLQNETSGDPFAQPVGVYNNIENGFGIFSGFSQSAFEYEK
jgi:hypothetical protein